VVCADDVRERKSSWRRDDPLTWSMKPQVQREISRALRERLEAGQPTVYDNTNVRKRNRETLLRGLLDAGAFDVRYVVLDRPLESKLADRGWRPEQLIREQHRLFLEELPAILAGDGRAYVTVEDRRFP
jgi:predicted kinase